jgi:hypothetical protein
VAVCANDDQSRFAKPDDSARFLDTTQTYGLPVVFTQTADTKADVGKLAPEAGYLLTAAYPYLSSLSLARPGQRHDGDPGAGRRFPG